MLNKNSKESPIYTRDELWLHALNWSIKEWTHEIGNLTCDQISFVIAVATPEQDPMHWKEKLAAAISGITEKDQLETLGKSLTLEQANEVIPYAFKDSSTLDKLPPLFVGMKPELFSQLMATLTSDRMQVLKQDALIEPIQYHLTLLTANMNHSFASFVKKVEDAKEKLSTLSIKDIAKEDIIREKESINLLSIEGKEAIKIIASALGIAWNTLRIDLIEQLSKTKEQYLKFIQHDVGTPENEEGLPTGLYAVLKKRLNSVFENVTLNNNTEPLPNDTPAIEAIVKFGIWYLRDYVEIGLLDENAINAGEKNEESVLSKKLGTTLKEALYSLVNQKLKNMGFVVLLDLKRASIFSKKALKDYISSYSPS